MEYEDGYRLSEEELLESGPCLEGGPSVVVPGRGGTRALFEWDGQQGTDTVKLAVIRPCVSRGKKIRGLSPIYTEEMLAENAAVYSGWLMYMDHLTEGMREALAEILQERAGRSIRDLGGRILRSWYDPTFSAPGDDSRGYRPGAVLAEALPQPGARAMLEADPEILQVSHNAWPTGAVVGTHWGQKGAIIEGIKRTPEGSVDWVPRGGAGGQVLQEDEATAVSVLRGYYDASAVAKKLSEIETLPGLAEWLKENDQEALAEELLNPPKDDPPKDEERITKADVAGMIRDGLEQVQGEKGETVEEAARRIVSQREVSRGLADYAHELIEGAGLPGAWEEDLKRRYAVLPSGPSEALRLVEASAEEDEERSDREILKALIERDLEHAQKLIRESGGKVRVKGLGAGGKDEGGEGGAQSSASQKKSRWLTEIGGLTLVEGQKEEDALDDMIREGVRP